jgi:hypothetical protein
MFPPENRTNPENRTKVDVPARELFPPGVAKIIDDKGGA